MASVAGQFLCPHCNQNVQVDDPQPQQMIVCPHCAQEFILPAFEPPLQADATAVQSSGDELNAKRIQQFSLMRRATYRSRSYAIIAAAGCSAAVAQLGVMAVREVLWNGWSLWPIGYIASALAAALGAWHFIGQAIKLNQSIFEASASKSLDTAPDFAKLSDGSQHASDLERIR